jgi:formylglycine-generating enzyme required for sulfatase activity
MLGNAWEWCADYWSKDYYGKSPERHAKGPSSGPGRVVRGGSYASGREVHLATRTWRKPGYRYRSIGFRCARDARKQSDE